MNSKSISKQKFWEYVNKTKSCWIWTGDKFSTGYGRFHDGKKQTHAHRFAYIQSVGEIPKGKELDHLCRNRACVNPNHLEPVTHGVNVLRGISPSAINARKTCCNKGHELSGDNLQICSDGRRRCIACMRVVRKLWGQNHPEKEREYSLRKKLKRRGDSV